MAGFREARGKVIKALLESAFRHEERSNQEQRNLLASGGVTSDEVVTMLKGCRGTQHETQTHHQQPATETHIFKPTVGPSDEKVTWYIKVYFEDPDTIFISVHESDYQ